MGACVSERTELEYTSSTHTERSPLTSPDQKTPGSIETIPIEKRQLEFSKSLRAHKKYQDEYEYLARITIFSVETLRLLHNRFKAIDQIFARDGTISFDEFAMVIDMPEKCILLKRFWRYIDKNDLGVNFRIFAKTMSILSNKNRNRFIFIVFT